MDGLEDAGADSARENLRAVRTHYESFARGDIDAVLEGLDYGVTIRIHDEHGVRLGSPRVGRSAARSFFESIHGSVEDASVEIRDLRADGGRVLAKVTLGGTLKGSGRAGEIQAVHLFMVADGLITEIRTHRPNWNEHEPDHG